MVGSLEGSGFTPFSITNLQDSSFVQEVAPNAKWDKFLTSQLGFSSEQATQIDNFIQGDPLGLESAEVYNEASALQKMFSLMDASGNGDGNLDQSELTYASAAMASMGGGSTVTSTAAPVQDSALVTEQADEAPADESTAQQTSSASPPKWEGLLDIVTSFFPQAKPIIDIATKLFQNIFV